MSIRSLVKQILIQKENRKYGKLLAERCMTYEQWIELKEAADTKQLEIQQKEAEGATTQGTCGTMPNEMPGRLQFRCFVASEGTPAENALLKIAQYFEDHPEVKILYGDEDVLEDGVRKSPWFKPDWSPDLLDSCFYFGSVVAVREELVQRMEAVYDNLHDGCECGFATQKTHIMGLNESAESKSCYHVTDMSAFEEWVHVAVGLTGGYIYGSKAVGHITEVLFHCKDEGEQKRFLETSEYLHNVHMCVLRDFEDSWKNGTNDTKNDNENIPIISAVIPSKDHPEMLERCIRSFCMATRDYKTEIIIVDNGSDKDNKCYIEKIIENLQQEHQVEIIYLYQPMDFHFSKMCNLGAKRASGWHLLFLNDDVELVNPEAVIRMGALSDREWTGAVGLKLYYPDSDRIQHAGITNLPMGPVHKLQFLSDTESYYFDTNRGLRNVLAVTAACLMVEKEKFDEVGGFSEELPVAFNDVDLCFSLYEKGYHNVCINEMYAYHHESLSRGNDESVEKRARLMTERDKLYARHPKLEGEDPYYSKNLNREGLDVRIRPAYESADNRMQYIAGKLSGGTLEGYREDACVLLRVESLREGILQGYGVVLGDNNACYEKEIILIPDAGQPGTDTVSGKTEQQGVVYHIPTIGQYRIDLVENMQDQTNVALSGFWLELSKEVLASIPRGRYLVGMAVRNRVTGLKLFNKSNCYLINT